MNDQWEAKLRRLGVVKGTRNLKPTPPPSPPTPTPPANTPHTLPDEPQALTTLLPGLRLEENEEGACLVIDHVYPLTHEHGGHRVGDLLRFAPEAAVPLCGDPRLTSLRFHDFVFIDTETTGLAGAGTLAFMVGVGFYEGDAFVARQYFLRDHDDEPAMLQWLADLLQEKAGLISFNGRTFDLPLIDNRYLMNRMGRMVGAVREMPHLDLLPPARRLWRQRLGSVALVELEKHLLSLRRTQEDVPGWLIPRLYYDYLQHGDGREMARVFYHNRLDLISMASLAHRLLRQFHDPQPYDDALDLVSLGKWQKDLNLPDAAEANLRRALAQQALPLEGYQRGLALLADLLKRQERREEAVPLWQQAAVTSYDDVWAHVELAKHYEWHARDLAQAQHWTEEALRLVNTWSPARASLVQAELTHRLARVWRKKQGLGDDESEAA
ncbi:MAG: ribonuclease H-like domain-containing protein [Anaerolineales bacterium]|nr:ribonuclease H-like domain-containing protein [Anaerolineales bacterium]MCB8953479.1 ribonuclease H-like domain-containing protein [Ardenticatenales bacterium]